MNNSTQPTTQVITDLNLLFIPEGIKAIIFDCFGTLMHIQHQTKPYKELYLGLKKIIASRQEYAHWVMTNNINISAFFEDMDFPFNQLEKAQYYRFYKNLQTELESVRLFPETREVLSHLSEHYKLLLCSNLATPYGVISRSFGLPLNNLIMSYEAGYIKPENEMFSLCEKNAGVDKNEILFVGDNYRDDFQGAHQYGFHAAWLNRSIPDA